MCGRFTLTRSAAEVAEHFGLGAVPDFAPRFNVAPTQEAAVVRMRASGERVLEWRRFGLVPAWAKDAQGAARMINARIESVAERPAYRDAIRRRRCLVPADGFYEWQGRAGRRRPFHLALPGGRLFAIAGLYERWRGPGGEVIDSFALLTGPALGAVAKLHDRMPLILPEADYRAWLDRAAADPAALTALLGGGPGPALEARPVDTRVNDVRHDDPACLAEPREAELPLFPGG